MDLSAVKRDLGILLTVLGREKAGHVKCAFHEDRNPSMDIFQASDGVWLWKCHAGCGTGTVIDAVMKLNRLGTAKEALRFMEQKMGVKVGRDEEICEPRIDVDAAEALITRANEFLLTDYDAQETLLTKRGISNLEVVKKYRLGFLRDFCFKKWPGWTHTAWIIPVTEGLKLVGVKIHHEGPRDKKMPKCMWAPFGTYPAAKPVNGKATLWPPPEDFPGVEPIYLCPGELKALALIAGGLPATSVTSGKLSSRLVKRFRCRVSIAYDNDVAGKLWLETVTRTLQAEGRTPTPFVLPRSCGAPPSEAGPEEDLDETWAKALNAPGVGAIDIATDPVATLDCPAGTQDVVLTPADIKYLQQTQEQA